MHAQMQEAHSMRQLELAKSTNIDKLIADLEEKELQLRLLTRKRNMKSPDLLLFGCCCSVVVVVVVVIRDLTQNTTATAARTSPNKKFNEKNNGCARAL